MWRTNIIVIDSGAEIRNQQWSYPRHEYDVAYGVKEKYQLENLISFFQVMAGQAIGFRYKDHSDFKSCQYSTGTINSSDCVLTTASNTTAVQIYKTYTQGSYVRSRKILKPTTNVLVSVNGTNLTTSQFAVDTTNGIINISTGYSTGVVIKAGFEFDVPVRFNTDSLNVNLEDYQVGSAQVLLIELKWADT